MQTRLKGASASSWVRPAKSLVSSVPQPKLTLTRPAKRADGVVQLVGAGQRPRLDDVEQVLGVRIGLPAQLAGPRRAAEGDRGQRLRPGALPPPVQRLGQLGVLVGGEQQHPPLVLERRQGRRDGPLCRLDLFPPWDGALDGLDAYPTVEVLYWLDRSRRDLLRQSPKGDGTTRGTFALRSPVRPNPIGTALAALVGIEGATVLVRGLDCLDGTPLLDIKPDRCAFTPLAPRQPGDDDVDPALPRA